MTILGTCIMTNKQVPNNSKLSNTVSELLYDFQLLLSQMNVILVSTYYPVF